MILKGGTNAVLVKLDRLFEDNTGKKGHGGKELVLDTSDPAEQAKHVRTYGEALQIPLRMTKKPLLEFQYDGFPAYGPESKRYHMKTVRDIQQDVEVGDRVYFHYNTVMMRMHTPTGKITLPDRENFICEHDDGSVVFKVNYDNIIATVKKDGRIVPIGGYILCEPDMESWDDISIPTYYDKNKRLKKPKNQWIVTKAYPEHKPLRAYVRHIGSPMVGDEYNGLQEGDYVIYRPAADWPVKIEGKELFPIKYRNLLAKIEE